MRQDFGDYYMEIILNLNALWRSISTKSWYDFQILNQSICPRSFWNSDYYKDSTVKVRSFFIVTAFRVQQS